MADATRAGSAEPALRQAELDTDVLVVGSGAGGASVAATLAEAGREVLILEEGPAIDTARMETHTPQALLSLARNAGLSPIFGRSAIGFVEGRCVGGSTEINSAFWHRLPTPVAARWTRDHGLDGLSESWLDATYQRLERELAVQDLGDRQPPPSSRVFARGLERAGLPVEQVPRAQSGDPCATQFGAGKQSMSRTLLPRALAAGARLIADARVVRLRHRGERAHAADVEIGGRTRSVRFRQVFLCAGAIQTPAVLRRSGFRGLVGATLRVQPMLKVAAEFREPLDAQRGAMPVFQSHVRDEGFFLGGSVYTPGFLAVTLADRWPEGRAALEAWRHSALFYVSCGGDGAGSVRSLRGMSDAIARYAPSQRDVDSLGRGLVRLCEALFAGGAVRVTPGLYGAGPLRSPDDAHREFDRGVPLSRMSLTTVHVMGSCPMGADPARHPVAPDGRVRGAANVRVADGSVLPEAPGVNPQGSVMALALHTAERFREDTAPEGAR